MKTYDFEQYSEEWYKIRLGVPTASKFDKLVTMKGEQSKQRGKYLYQLAGEFVACKAEETYQNAAMQRGLEMEGEARNLYEVVNDVSVEQIGFCIGSPDIEYGCSPDGLVGKDGLIEIKCPSIAVHVEYLLKGGLPSTYFQQVHGQMLVTGRKWCDFMSYYPGIKPLIVRIKRDEKFIEKLEFELKVFSKELMSLIKEIN